MAPGKKPLPAADPSLPLLLSLPGSWLKVTDYLAEKNLPVFQPGVKVGSRPGLGRAFHQV